MATWRDMADEAQRDAATLKSSGRLRGAINRCYYALLSHVAFVASKSGYTMPAGWEGPSHVAVYEGGIVANHLRHRVNPVDQGRLIWIAATLYKLRCDADYSPSSEFADSDVRLAFGRLLEARKILGGL